jgi:hypothetical protein
MELREEKVHEGNPVSMGENCYVVANLNRVLVEEDYSYLDLLISFCNRTDYGLGTTVHMPAIKPQEIDKLIEDLQKLRNSIEPVEIPDLQKENTRLVKENEYLQKRIDEYIAASLGCVKKYDGSFRFKTNRKG